MQATVVFNRSVKYDGHQIVSDRPNTDERRQGLRISEYRLMVSKHQVGPWESDVHGIKIRTLLTKM